MDLIGDIGGTHARLAWARAGAIRHVQTVTAAGDDALAAAITVFLAGQRARAVCFAGAGVEQGGRLALTNRNLTLCSDRLAQLSGTDRVWLVNDMIGQGHGIDALPPEAWQRLAGPATGPQGGARGAARIIMNIGTGLNTCVLHGAHVPVSEAGHVSLPQTDSALRAFAVWRGGRAIAEDVLSGRGLSLVARHLTGQEMPADRAADLPAVRALFAAALAEHLADMVLSHMATGGAVLTGGVTLALAGRINWPALHRRMAGSGPYAGLLSGVPLARVSADDLVLRGCARLAATL